MNGHGVIAVLLADFSQQHLLPALNRVDRDLAALCIVNWLILSVWFLQP